MTSGQVHARQVFGKCKVHLNEAKAIVMPASCHMLLPVAARPDTAHVAPAPIFMSDVFYP